MDFERWKPVDGLLQAAGGVRRASAQSFCEACEGDAELELEIQSLPDPRQGRDDSSEGRSKLRFAGSARGIADSFDTRSRILWRSRASGV